MTSKNTDSEELIASDIAATMRVRDHIYAIVPTHGSVTFYAQQRRAFNLIWALAETRRICSASTIGIVGGGLAGVSVAAAAGMIDCNCSLFFAEDLLFHQQRGNTTRYIHPNILDWPQEHATNRHTDLPFLNWSANYCNEVIEEIESQLESVGNIDFNNNRQVTKVTSTSNGARITTSSPFDQFDFDCVICCPGFGKERVFGGIKSESYWENDPLHQIDFSDGKNVLITGTGDGGLIDLMRLMLLNFKHENVLEDVANFEPLCKLGPKLLQADKNARTAANPSEAGYQLMKVYKDLKVENMIPDSLNDNIRRNASITLNGEHETPFQLSSSIINRVIAYTLIRRHAVEYIDGKTLRERRKIEKFNITFERSTEPQQKSFDRVVVRHGPSGALESLIGKRASDQFLKPSKMMIEAGVKAFWPQNYFNTPHFGRSYLDISMRRAASYFPEIQKIVSKKYSPRTSVQISIQAGHAVYVVDDNISPCNRIKMLARIPVVYRHSQKRPTESIIRSQESRYRPLCCGVSISNCDLARRNCLSGSSGLATVGCFVKTSDGRRGLLTTHAVTGFGKLSKGDLLVQPSGSSDLAKDGVAHLESEIGLKTDGSLTNCENSSDVVFALIFDDVEIFPGFLPHLQLPIPKRVGDLNRALGAGVWVVGASNGARRCQITGIMTTLMVKFGQDSLWFKECFEFEPLDNTKFEGGSGQIVMDNDGTVFGLTFATNGRQSYGFNLLPVIQYFGCRLIS